MATQPPVKPDDIPEIPLTETPPKRLTMNREEFFTQSDIWNDNLAYVWQPAYNVSVDAMNDTNDWINNTSKWMNDLSSTMENDYKSFSSQMSAYVAAAAQSATDSKNSADASEISYRNTVSVIAQADISGTAGYTMEVVDDMFSRQKKLTFCGFNIKQGK